MAFKPVGTLNPHGAPVLRKAVLANSLTAVASYASMKVSSGFSTQGTTGALVFGHVDAFITAKGVSPLTTGASGAAIGSFVGALTTASDNQTVAQNAALHDVSKATLYSVDPDATIGTTTGSNLLGYYTDIADSVTTDESTAATSTAQYLIHGVDPADSTNQIVSIYESAVWGV